MRRALLTLEFMPSPGGIERLLHERAKAYQPESTTVFAPNSPGAKEFDRTTPYRIVRTSARFRKIPLLRRLEQTYGPIFAFLRAHKKDRFEELECGQAFPFPLFFWMFTRFVKTPYIIWVHGNDFLAPLKIPLLKGWLRKAFFQATLVVTNSHFVAQLVKDQGVLASKIRTMNPFVDTEKFHPIPQSDSVLERHHWKNHQVLLTVGRLVERKGIDSVIHCLPKLLSKHPKVRYLVIGNGPEMDRLKDLRKKLGLEEIVCLAGFVPEESLISYYSSAYAFVMPSKFIPKKGSVEGLGLVYLEANACGLPVIAGKAGGVVDIVHHERNGLLVNPEDLNDISTNLDRILGDSQLRNQMAEEGLRIAQRPADWSFLSLKNLS